MKKYYNLTRSDKAVFIVDEETLDGILKTQNQQIMIQDIYGVNILVNKAHIIGADENLEIEHDRAIEQSKKLGTIDNKLATREQIKEYDNLRNGIIRIKEIIKQRHE